MLFFAFVADIGANTLFLSVYYGISLLRNEFTATSSIHMKSVPYGGMAVPPLWKRQFPFVGTSVSLNGNEIGLRVSVGHMEPLLYVLLSYGY